ncbi:LamG domain-containing protein, partial [Bacteroidales bacterium OttesenSCG-928-A17]|nr:LamG domain-containing protein [Bacteroidales bacterium OttesenSCG-928-A17]
MEKETNIENNKAHSFQISKALKKLLILPLLFFCVSAYAYDSWNIGWNTVEFLPDQGRIKVSVRYYQTWGAGGDGWSGFCRNKGGNLKLTIGSYTFNISCVSDSEGTKLTVSETTGKAYGSYTYSSRSTDGKEYEKYVDIWVKLAQTEINSQVNVMFQGKWWRRNPATDETVNASTSVSTTISMADIGISDCKYTSYLSQPAYQITWSKSTNANAAGYGSLVLCDESGNEITSGFLGVSSFSAKDYNSGTFYISATDAVLNSSQQYRVKQTYTPPQNNSIKYTKESTVHTRPAYPQVSTDLEAKFDSSTKKVILSWGISNAQAANNVNDVFQLEIHNKTKNTKVYPRIAFTTGKTSYSHEFTITEGVIEEYDFKVYRPQMEEKNGWEKFTKYCRNFSVNTNHVRPTNAIVKLSDDNKSAIITWDIDGSVWSSGTKFTLTRINLTTSASEDIHLTKDGFNAKQYKDEMIRICNEYQYKLMITPNEEYGNIAPIYTESIIPSEIGDILSVVASKGYYSDRVEISWKVEGGFDEFSIRRKPHGAPDSEYKQISTMKGSAVQSSYMTKDEIGVPGVIYEYQISGLVLCANEPVSSPNAPSDIGFRTPTGDIYGQVTFENGQAVEGVEVNVVTEEEMDSRSLEFESSQAAYVNNTALLKENVDSISIQAWISPSTTSGTQLTVSKSGMYELGIKDDHFFFKAGSTTVSTDTLTVSKVKGLADFMHVTGVYNKDSLYIYIDGKLINKEKMAGSVTGNDNRVTFGRNYTGIIDEVRIWDIPLSAEIIKRDYNRYLTGGEKGLIAYWTFNYAVENAFFDISFSGVNFNENHGNINGVTLTSDPNKTPPSSQLGYRGVTGADGSYSVRSIPYKGNSTAYQVIPQMGIHQFNPKIAPRNIGLGSQSHTVNFVDVSSFRVAGYVTYLNSIIPVEGVSFTIDGKMALRSNGMPYQTDATGKFEIMVPVGSHEVMATKSNHTFTNDGRITDQYGNDLNYQDAISEIELKDNTTVKYIGRVAGGTIQEAYPIGHSLSTNNLAEGVTVKLSYINEAYYFKYPEDEKIKTESHFKPSNKKEALENKVEYTGRDIIIYPNETTGEFVAYVIPEIFNVSVNVPGHPNVTSQGMQANFTQQFNVQEEVYAYKDSVNIGKDLWEVINYSDTVRYQAFNKFIKRYAPTIRVTQMSKSNEPLPYFGTDTTTITNMLGEVETVPLYSAANGYTFKKPVFIQYENYNMQIKIYEDYIFYDKDEKPTGVRDEVPTQDATIAFDNEIAPAGAQKLGVEVDDEGIAYYSFSAGEPEETSAIKKMTATVTIKTNTGTSTPFSWIHPDNFTNGDAFVLGAKYQGADFVTAGPEKLLTVLRDPPGSNSYSYLEKGLSFEESSTYTGSIKNSGAEDFTTGVELPIISWHGVGSGVINIVQESGSGVTVGVSHEEEYQGQDTKKTKTTTTTRFETSSDPLYVGASGDLFIGYSTNISFGGTENITIVSRQRYEDGKYTDFYAESDDWVMVKNSGISASQSFHTLYAHPQIHIEERLIPELKQRRNDLIFNRNEYNIDDLQAFATANDTVFYVSYFPEDSEHFGKSNNDKSLAEYINENGNPEDEFDGPSYRVIYNPNTAGVSDTIVVLNQYIDGWIDALKENEKQKVEA